MSIWWAPWYLTRVRFNAGLGDGVVVKLGESKVVVDHDDPAVIEIPQVTKVIEEREETVVRDDRQEDVIDGCS